MAKGNTNPAGAMSGAGNAMGGGNTNNNSPLGGMAGATAGSNMQPQMRGMAPGNFGTMNKTFAGSGGGNMNGVNGQPLGPGPDLGKGGDPYWSQQAVRQRGGNTGVNGAPMGTDQGGWKNNWNPDGTAGPDNPNQQARVPPIDYGGMQPQIQPWRENTGRMGGWGGGGYRDNMPRMRMGGQQPQMPVMMNDSPIMKAIQDGTFNPRDYAQPNGGMHPMDKGGGNSDYYEKGIGQPNLFPGLGGNFNPGNMRDMMGSAPMGGFGNPRAWG